MHVIFETLRTGPSLSLCRAGIVFAAISLAGCGGPKYKEPFKEWLGLKLATEQPIKLERVAVEEISAGKIETVFTFSGKFSVTRDLYETVEVSDDQAAAAKVVSDRLATLGMIQSGEGGALLSSLRRELSTPILRIATPNGHRGEFSGKVKASLNDDGSWSFQILEVSSIALDGTSPPEGEKWLLEGSREAKEHVENLKKQIAEMNAFVDAAEKKAEEARKQEEVRLAEEQRKAEEERKKEEARLAEEQRKVEEEAKKREEAFLAEIAPGREIVGLWQGKQSRGELGIRFGNCTKFGEGYSLDGVLFDPANRSLTKPFVGKTQGKGTSESPYEFEFSVLKSNSITESETIYRQTLDKTAGFLLQRSGYNAHLIFNPNDGSFSGLLVKGDIYSPHISGVFSYSKIPLQFSKGYAPQSSAAGTKPPSPSSESTSAPTEGGKYRMSLEETTRQMAASDELYQAVNDAMRRRDRDGFHKAVAELQKRYPDSPNTLLAEMMLAATKGDKAKIRQLHSTLVNEYPLDDTFKEMVNDFYQKALKARD